MDRLDVYEEFMKGFWRARPAAGVSDRRARLERAGLTGKASESR